MSFRQSTSGADALSFSRNGLRTPLRSLQNEIVHPSTESTNFKAKSFVSSEPLKHSNVNAALEVLKNAPATTDMFAQSSVAHFAYRSYSTDEQEINQTCNSSDITVKSFECEGGEVEISDSLAEEVDDTIPLPQPGLSEYQHLQQTLDSSNLLDGTDDCNNADEKTDHLYCMKESSMACENLQDTAEALGNITLKLMDCTGGEIEIENSIHLHDQTIPLPADQSWNVPESYVCGAESILFTEEVDHIDHPYCNTKAVDGFHVTNDASVHVVEEKDLTNKETDCKNVSVISSELSEHYNKSIKDTTDSALGLSANAPPALPASTEPSQAETLPDVFKVISECTPHHLKFLTPIVRRASLAYRQALKETAEDQTVVDDCAQFEEKSLKHPLDHAEFWKENLDSPIPRPLFNSTELIHRSQGCVVTEAKEDVSPALVAVDKPVPDVPVMADVPLQQQLRQMAELLMLASGKMGSDHFSAPATSPPKAECHNACVGTSPMRMVNHSINTSGQFEKQRSVCVVDQSTLTDPLLWNVPGSLQNVHDLSWNSGYCPA
ncbi:hypothetical protein WMY93_006924 [Mugilogobius chulae]|uniref:Uncharacterized protein n=1 Tax=Mugilogobius chulae TaxID=88201 RepID=A0AAW0PVK7_9GOBI